MLIINVFIEIITRASLMFLITIGSLIVVGLVLDIIRKGISRYNQIALGAGGILITAWIGVPVHELGHALMCVIFGHKIVDMKLLTVSSTGVKGYVRHSYNPKNIYHKIGNFFIGIAPLINGIVVIMLIGFIFIPNEFKEMSNIIKEYSIIQFSFEHIRVLILDLLGELFNIIFTFNNLKSIRFWIFMIMVIGISSHMSLSREDLKGAISGLSALYLLFIIINIILSVLGIEIFQIMNYFSIYSNYLIFALIFVFFCALCSLFLSFLLYSIVLSLIN